MTFLQWLTGFRHEGSPCGDLARDVARDTQRPRLTTRAAWSGYLTRQSACLAAHEALEDAWDTYEQETGRRSTREVQYLCPSCDAVVPGSPAQEIWCDECEALMDEQEVPA